VRGLISQAVVVGAAIVASAGTQDAARRQEVAALLARVGARVEQYFARAQSIVCEETVRLQPLGLDLLWDGGHVRQLVYELRVEWDGATAPGAVPEATVARDLVLVDGRRPRPGDEPACMDPKPISTEPLAMLLPGRQRDYRFNRAGTTRTRDGSMVMVDFQSVVQKPPEITWDEECVSVELPGRSRGRVWIDEATSNVLRLDEQLVGTFDVPVPREQVRRGAPSLMTFERATSSIRYHAVPFQDPDEVVMLPESVVSLQTVRNAARPRVRTFQTFSRCRRFVTDARIVRPN
jgi:hypothetical protein